MERELPKLKDVVDVEADILKAKIIAVRPEYANAAEQAFELVKYELIRKDQKSRDVIETKIKFAESLSGDTAELLRSYSKIREQLHVLAIHFSRPSFVRLTWKTFFNPEAHWHHSINKKFLAIEKWFERLADEEINAKVSLRETNHLIAGKIVNLINLTIKLQNVDLQEIIHLTDDGRLNPFGQLLLNLRVELDKVAPELAVKSNFVDSVFNYSAEQRLLNAILRKDVDAINVLQSWCRILNVKHDIATNDNIIQAIVNKEINYAHCLVKNGFFDVKIFKYLKDLKQPETEKAAIEALFVKKPKTMMTSFTEIALKIYFSDISLENLRYFAQKLNCHNYSDNSISEFPLNSYTTEYSILFEETSTDKLLEMRNFLEKIHNRTVPCGIINKVLNNREHEPEKLLKLEVTTHRDAYFKQKDSKQTQQLGLG